MGYQSPVSDQPYLISIKDSEPNIFTQLIPKDETKSNKTHLSLVINESKSIANIALPMILTGLLLYSRSMVSMLFLGYLGELSLAGGALAIGFANITGYSILSGLAMGMEPICGQAFGAKKLTLLGLSLQKTVLMLLSVSIPIGFLWLNMKKTLMFFGQDEDISNEAQKYILYSLPDLFLQSLLHPLRIYLRSQSITLPLTFCATLSIILHIPINYFLVSYLNLGIQGVALSGVWTNFNLVGSLIIYIYISRIYEKTWGGLSSDCLKDWKSLLNLAIPSCISVCLEWWWYEIMILLCGLLINPRATIAALIYIFQSFTVSKRVGNELGANQPKKARIAAITGPGMLTAKVRNIWAKMFTKYLDLIKLTSTLIEICTISPARAAGTSKNLSKVPQICQVIEEEGVAKIMINILDSGLLLGSKEYAAESLKNLTFGNESLRKYIISQGGIHTLLTYLDSPLPQESAVEALKNLINLVPVETLLSFGCLPRLVHVLKDGSLGAQEAAASTISEVCSSLEMKKILGEYGCISLLVKMLESRSNGAREVSSQALSSLITLSQNCREVKKDEKSVPNLVQLLDPSPQNTSKKYAVSCLWVLSSSQKCKKLMISYGAIGYLKKLSEMEILGAKKLLERLERGKLKSLFIRK